MRSSHHFLATGYLLKKAQPGSTLESSSASNSSGRSIKSQTASASISITFWHVCLSPRKPSTCSRSSSTKIKASAENFEVAQGGLAKRFRPAPWQFVYSPPIFRRACAEVHRFVDNLSGSERPMHRKRVKCHHLIASSINWHRRRAVILCFATSFLTYCSQEEIPQPAVCRGQCVYNSR